MVITRILTLKTAYHHASIMHYAGCLHYHHAWCKHLTFDLFTSLWLPRFPQDWWPLVSGGQPRSYCQPKIQNEPRTYPERVSPAHCLAYKLRALKPVFEEGILVGVGIKSRGIHFSNSWIRLGSGTVAGHLSINKKVWGFWTCWAFSVSSSFSVRSGTASDQQSHLMFKFSGFQNTGDLLNWNVAHAGLISGKNLFGSTQKAGHGGIQTLD